MANKVMQLDMHKLLQVRTMPGSKTLLQPGILNSWACWLPQCCWHLLLSIACVFQIQARGELRCLHSSTEVEQRDSQPESMTKTRLSEVW